MPPLGSTAHTNRCPSSSARSLRRRRQRALRPALIRVVSHDVPPAVGEGERKTGFTIAVSPLSETSVSGMVVFEDDRPVVEANVTAAPSNFGCSRASPT